MIIIFKGASSNKNGQLNLSNKIIKYYLLKLKTDVEENITFLKCANLCIVLLDLEDKKMMK